MDDPGDHAIAPTDQRSPGSRLSRNLRRAPQIIRNGARDLRFGRLLAGTVPTRFGHLGAFDVANSEYENMDILFASLSVGPADVLVDVGCGKGRATNWFLSRHPKNRIIGIELDPEVCAQTARRLKRFRNVSIVCDEVTTAIPADGTIFYLFNPFDEAVMRRFRDALVAARSGAPISTTVVYYNSKFLDVFSEDPRFSVAVVPDPRLPAQSAIITLR